MQLQGLPYYNHEKAKVVYDKYASAYNSLADKMVAAGLDHNELQEVIRWAQQEERLSFLYLLETMASWLKGEKPIKGY